MEVCPGTARCSDVGQKPREHRLWAHAPHFQAPKELSAMALAEAKTKMRAAEVFPQPGEFNRCNQALLDAFTELLCISENSPG